MTNDGKLTFEMFQKAMDNLANAGPMDIREVVSYETYKTAKILVGKILKIDPNWQPFGIHEVFYKAHELGITTGLEPEEKNEE